MDNAQKRDSNNTQNSFHIIFFTLTFRWIPHIIINLWLSSGTLRISEQLVWLLLKIASNFLSIQNSWELKLCHCDNKFSTWYFKQNEIYVFQKRYHKNLGFDSITIYTTYYTAFMSILTYNYTSPNTWKYVRGFRM